MVSSGDLSLVEDRALRSRISSLARGLEDISRFEMDEANSTQDQLLPYLAAAGDLVAVARAQKTYPGTSESYAGSENLPPGGSFDHSEMVRSREFRNVVVMRYWAVSDLRRSYAELQVLLDAAAASISAALGELATAV